jgi:hypothetical protein
MSTHTKPVSAVVHGAHESIGGSTPPPPNAAALWSNGSAPARAAKVALQSTHVRCVSTFLDKNRRYIQL